MALTTATAVRYKTTVAACFLTPIKGHFNRSGTAKSLSLGEAFKKAL